MKKPILVLNNIKYISILPVTYRNWHGGEPNNQLKNGGDMGSGRENCGEVFENKIIFERLKST